MSTFVRTLRSSRSTLFAAGALATMAALLLAGCGSSTKTSGTTVGNSSAATSNAGAAGGGGGVTISTASVGTLGTVLVNGSGKTLYLLTSEHGANMPCSATNGCFTNWPPETLPAGVSSATAGSGVDQSKLGVVTTGTGAHLVTYVGYPLFTFAHDSGAGSANGEGISSFGGTWEALMADGTPVTPGSTTDTSAGYHY